MSFRTKAGLAGVLALTLAVPIAAEPGARPAEFPVSRPHDSHQANPAAAFGPGGVSLIVWEDTKRGIQGQLYDAAGTRVGGARTLVPNRLPPIPGSGAADLAVEPTAVFLPGGDFLVAWASERGHLKVEAFHQDFERAERRVMARRFGSAGEPAGPVFEIGSGRRFESWPRLHVVPDGPVLAVWRGDVPAGADRAPAGLFARQLSRRGEPRTAEVRVSAPGDAEAQYASFAQGGDGKVLVAWEGCCDAGGDLGVYARTYDPASRSFGPRRQINATTAQKQRRPSVAPAAGGGYLVVWQGILDRTTGHIFGRFVDGDGAPSSGQFRVSHGHGPVQVAPAVAPAPGGGFLAVWRDWIGVSFGMTALELDAAGQPVGSGVRLNSRKTQKSGRTSLAADGTGGYLVPWEVGFGPRPGIAAGRIWLD